MAWGFTTTYAYVCVCMRMCWKDDLRYPVLELQEVVSHLTQILGNKPCSPSATNTLNYDTISSAKNFVTASNVYTKIISLKLPSNRILYLADCSIFRKCYLDLVCIFCYFYKSSTFLTVIRLLIQMMLCSCGL